MNRAAIAEIIGSILFLTLFACLVIAILAQ